MSGSSSSISLLQQQEADADNVYGFPAGTLEALGTSESTQGLFTGNGGGIFQVVPSTASQPGYGLTSVNGNDPYSVGAYLSALINGPGGGSVANGLAIYQGRPIGSTGNKAMTAFLNQLSGMLSGNPAAQLGFNAGTSAVTGQTIGTNPLSSLEKIALQIAFAVLAIILIGLGVAALALKDSPQGVVQTVVKAATA